MQFQNFYDAKIKDMIKCMGDTKYFDKNKEWIAPRDSYNLLVELLGKLCFEKSVKIQLIPEFLERFTANSRPWSLPTC